MILSERMSVLIEYASILDWNTLADIGCDHGYIPIVLAKKYPRRHIIASDIRLLPLEKAKSNAIKHEVFQNIDFRYAGGLAALDRDEADVVIIAGMGGELIAKILDDDIEKSLHPSFILQTPQAPHILREFLWKNKFKISADIIHSEKRYIYHTMICSYTGEQVAFTPFEAYFGKRAPGNLSIVEKNYFSLIKKNLQIRVNGLINKANPSCDELQELAFKKSALDEIITLEGGATNIVCQ